MPDFSKRKTVKEWTQQIVGVLGKTPGRWMSRGQIAAELGVPLTPVHRTVLEMLVLFGYAKQREGRSDVANVEFRYEYQLVEAPMFED